MKRSILITLSFITFVRCGSESLSSFPETENGDPGQDQSIGANDTDLDSPFAELTEGDEFPWGTFIRPPFRTTEIDSLPIPVFLALFDEDEKEIIQQGIAIANSAIGFEALMVEDEFNEDARVIYKVSDVFFNDPTYDMNTTNTIVGYTYSRNIYMGSRYEAGRIVTDWAMEVREDFLNKWVIAHELGHAFGIQKHALINYEEDALENLEPNSLMAPSITVNPTLDDYNYMMKKQGELILNYLNL